MAKITARGTVPGVLQRSGQRDAVAGATETIPNKNLEQTSFNFVHRLSTTEKVSVSRRADARSGLQRALQNVDRQWK